MGNIFVLDSVDSKLKYIQVSAPNIYERILSELENDNTPIAAFKKERQEKLEEELTPPQRETTEEQFSNWVESAFPSNEGFGKLFL